GTALRRSASLRSRWRYPGRSRLRIMGVAGVSGGREEPLRFGSRSWERMMSSLQHKLDRVRRPRVQITYDVETNGALQKVELPFVVGVMADLPAHPKDALNSMKDRKFVPIDRDNFNEVLAKSAPRLAMKVQN